MRELYDSAERAIANAGGLVTSADLARRWGVSAARASQLTNHPTFPASRFLLGRQRVWFAFEADEWRKAR